LGQSSPEREDAVTEQIIARGNAVIAGIGKLEHYALVFGVERMTKTIITSEDSYKKITTERWRINNGWGGQEVSDASITRGAFFVGRLSPGGVDQLEVAKPTPKPNPGGGHACTSSQKCCEPNPTIAQCLKCVAKDKECP
jgi:hypothetical protein